MKLLCSALFLSCIYFCAYTQHISSDYCFADENFYRLRIRGDFQQQHPDIKYPLRPLKESEYCIIADLQSANKETVYVVDIRYEVIIYPKPSNQ